MKKKILALTMIFCLVGVAVLSGTLAYFTDSEQATNVFTVGKIDITLEEAVGVFTAKENGNEIPGKMTKTDNGVYYSNIMPTNYLEKKVTITNNENPAYVRVIVVMNNYLEINKAIDDVYEAEFGKDTAEVQEKYDLVFDGWDIVYTKPDAEGVRGTIDKVHDNLLRTDLVTAIDEYTMPAKGNWYENTSVTSATNDFSGYYSCILNAYERAYVYYLYMEEDDEITLFNGINCPAEFTQEQAKMFENLKIEVYADAIQAESFTGSDAKNKDNAKKAFDALNEAHPIASIRTPSTTLVEINSVEGLKYAASVGGTYKLTADVPTDETFTIPEGTTLTLDLNGKKITGNFPKSEGAVVKNNGTLTITGGEISSLAPNGGSALQNNGTATVNGTTLNGATAADGNWPSYTINNTGALTINNSKITSVHGAVCSYGANAVLTLNDSEIAMSGIPGFTSHALYTYNSGKIIVNDGTYSNNATDQNSTGGSCVNGTVIVTAGTFNGRIDPYYGTPSFTGGTFTANPSAWVADGYHAVDNGNGTYTVKLKTHDNSSDVSDAINAGEKVVLGADVEWNQKLTTDAEINLNGNAFKPTDTIKLINNSDLTMTGGEYTVNGTYGHIDVRPDSAEGSKVVFEDVDFAFNKLSKTFGTCTDRLGSVLEYCGTSAGAKAEILFKNCTFDNAKVLFEGMSDKTCEFEATFEGCTFNCLTSSAPIEVMNYIKGTINVIDCTFNIVATSGSASAISISPSSSTSIVLNAKDNTLYATAATPYTHNVSLGETEEHDIKVHGTVTKVKFVSAYGNATVNVTNTTTTGIAVQ